MDIVEELYKESEINNNSRFNIEKYLEQNIDKTLDIFNPCLDEFFSKYNKLSKKRFFDYILESNPNLSSYLIIIINNSSNSNGLSQFIKEQMFLIDINVKIYLYKQKGLDYIVGPIRIDSFEKICFITNYIVNYIKRDLGTNFKFNMEKDIENNLSNDSNNKLIYWN